MSTAAFANKRVIFDTLASYTGPGLVLDGVQVEYSFPGAPTSTLIYGGRITFDQPDDADVTDGDDVICQETATIWLYVRVTGDADVRDAEARAEKIGDALGSIIRKNSRMCGPNTYVRIAGGTSDHSATDDGPIVILAYRLIATAYV